MREVIKTKVQNFRLSVPQEVRFKKLIGYRGYWSWSEVIIGGLLALERQRDIELANPPKLMEILEEAAAELPQIAAAQGVAEVQQAAELLPLNTVAEVREKLATLPKKGAARKTKPVSAAAELATRDQAGKNRPPATSPVKGRKAKNDIQSPAKAPKERPPHKGSKKKA